MIEIKKTIKIIAFTYILFCNSYSLKGQVILETIVDSLFLSSQFKIVKISNSESKYFFADTISNTFDLYNMDFTPFETNISVPEPFDITLTNFQVVYISRTLFDCDSSNIEFAYTSFSDINKSFRIIRTDGTILFQLDSANAPYCIGNCLGLTDIIRPITQTSDGAKLFLQKYNAGYQQIFIYSLCGDLNNNDEELFQAYNYVSIFPNPTSNTTTIKINKFDNLYDYYITIRNLNGNEIQNTRISKDDKENTINLSHLSSGIYLFTLRCNNKIIQSGRIVLTN